MDKPKNVAEYGVAAGEDHYQMSHFVNEQIEQGWQPFGNVFEYMRGEQRLVCQPMIRPGEVKKKSRIQSTTKK